MSKFMKVVLNGIILLVNALALWDILQQSEEALKLEYSLIIVSTTYFVVSFINNYRKKR